MWRLFAPVLLAACGGGEPPSGFDASLHRTPAIEGYAWRASARPGETVTLSVSTDAPRFRAALFRLGWYGGDGMRQVAAIGDQPGRMRPMPPIDAATGLAAAAWPASLSWMIDPAWPAGLYLTVLTASDGAQAYVPFVVRAATPGPLLFVHAAATDQAYNRWGGASLYVDDTGRLAARRAYRVSFDRPLGDGGGSGNLLRWEYPMARWLERVGHDVDYAADVDLADPAVARGRRGILVVGHAEYWTREMRDAVEAAVGAGTSLGAFAADTMYWQARLDGGGRVLTCYKRARADPLRGVDDRRVTVRFRDPPVSDPEQRLLGSMYPIGSWLPSDQRWPWVVADAQSWVFRGTGLKSGAALPGLVSGEFDTVVANRPEPAGVDVIASSPVARGRRRFHATATVYTAPSGAVVADLGTIRWAMGLDDGGRADEASLVNPAAQRITENLLDAFLARRIVHPTP